MTPTLLVKSYLGPDVRSDYTSLDFPYPNCGIADYTIIPEPPSNVFLDHDSSQIIVYASATTPLG